MRESENTLLMLQAVLVEVDMQNRGAAALGVRLLPSSSASLFNYLKSETVSLQVCENPVSLAATWCSDILRGQPCLCTSVRLPPAWVPFSLQALCGGGFGQEFGVSASAMPCALSPAGLH